MGGNKERRSVTGYSRWVLVVVVVVVVVVKRKERMSGEERREKMLWRRGVMEKERQQRCISVSLRPGFLLRDSFLAR